MKYNNYFQILVFYCILYDMGHIFILFCLIRKSQRRQNGAHEEDFINALENRL